GLQDRAYHLRAVVPDARCHRNRRPRRGDPALVRTGCGRQQDRDLVRPLLDSHLFRLLRLRLDIHALRIREDQACTRASGATPLRFNALLRVAGACSCLPQRNIGMLVAKSYKLPEFLYWTRRSIYALLVISAVPVFCYQVLDMHWLVVPWSVVLLLGTAVALMAG